MCVVAIAQEKNLTEEHVKRMFGSNRDGAGVAWRQDGRVHWRKGLSEEEIRDLCLTLPLPYIAHFRIASCGGVRADLTHPFPIAKDVPLALKGSTSGSVLFHNGHYHRWKDQLLALATNNGIKVPTGAWSDSRLMAWVAAYCGTNILPFFDEKLVNFSPDDMDIFGVGWSEVDGLYVSNRTWEHTHHVYQNLVCRYRACKRTRTDDSVYCDDHLGGVEKAPILHRDATKSGPQGVSLVPSTFRRGDNTEGAGSVQQEAVEEMAKSLRRGRTTGEEGESQEGFVPDATLEERGRMHAWVRRLNPKTLHARTTPPNVLDDEAFYQGFSM